MPYFSFMIAVPLYWMDFFSKIWTPVATPEGVKSEEKTD